MAQRIQNRGHAGAGSAVAGPRPDRRRGAALLMVTVAIVALMSFAIISIDGAVLLTTKGQLQNAADAAALAGASALLDGDQTLATTRAIEFAGYNQATQDLQRSVIITEADVTFPQPDIIRVETHRTAATGDPLRTYFRRLINPLRPNEADVTAVAMAQGFDLCSAQCLKPWAIPDQWDDANANGEYDAGEYYEPEVTSYKAPEDLGRSITLKVGNPQQAIAPGNFYPVDYPPLNHPSGESPLTGGSWYRTWISECNPYTISVGDELQLEPGNMVGPTFEGMDGLFQQDPGAYWDSGTNTVAGSTHGLSPRIILVPFFDPTRPPTSGRNSVFVSKVGVFFLEQIQGNTVVGRFTNIIASGDPCSTGAPGAGQAFIQGISLIR